MTVPKFAGAVIFSTIFLKCKEQMAGNEQSMRYRELLSENYYSSKLHAYTPINHLCLESRGSSRRATAPRFAPAISAEFQADKRGDLRVPQNVDALRAVAIPARGLPSPHRYFHYVITPTLRESCKRQASAY